MFVSFSSCGMSERYLVVAKRIDHYKHSSFTGGPFTFTAIWKLVVVKSLNFFVAIPTIPAIVVTEETGVRVVQSLIKLTQG